MEQWHCNLLDRHEGEMERTYGIIRFQLSVESCAHVDSSLSKIISTFTKLLKVFHCIFYVLCFYMKAKLLNDVSPMPDADMISGNLAFREAGRLSLSMELG